MTTATLITAEQLARMPQYEHGYELVAGELRKMSPIRRTHGLVETRLGAKLWAHVEQHGLGEVQVGEPGFIVARDPDTVLAPDIAFIGKGRVPADAADEGFQPGAPDIAVEILSPGDRLTEARKKANTWLDAGSAMVWLVNPGRRTVTVFRHSAEPKTLTEADELDGEEGVPGFRCPVAELFPQ